MLDYRRLARGLALQALYEIDSTAHPSKEVLPYRDASAFHNLDARILAYVTLHAHHVEGETSRDDEDLELATDLENALMPTESQEIVQKLVNGVLSYRHRLDNVIHRFAPDYKAEEMAIVDRNILRIAIYEFAISQETPIKVAINEAVELAKIFGADSTPGFVNGVLGSVAKQRDEIIAQLNAETGAENTEA